MTRLPLFYRIKNSIIAVYVTLCVIILACVCKCNTFSLSVCVIDQSHTCTHSFFLKVYTLTSPTILSLNQKLLCGVWQVKVWSSKELKVTVVKDEEELDELEHFSLWSMVQHWIHEKTNETSVSINLFNAKTCFRVDPSAPNVQYTVKSSRSECDTLITSLHQCEERSSYLLFYLSDVEFDIYLFLVFLAGMLLFFFADVLSR